MSAAGQMDTVLGVRGLEQVRKANISYLVVNLYVSYACVQTYRAFQKTGSGQKFSGALNKVLVN